MTYEDTAVLIPCFNEEMAIEKVVRDFKSVLPGARIFVYDNNSSDHTINVAKKAGAIVRRERGQGKGQVVRRMFADVEADVYLMVDGDDTYDAKAAPELIHALRNENLDMVNGRRISDIKEAYRPGHRFGNALLTRLVAMFFGRQFEDILSGYRAFSRRFVKSFPVLSQGFEIETELTIHALELRMPVNEIDTAYSDRAEGSESKLNTYRDGFRILRTIGVLLKNEQPLFFFSVVAATLIALASILIAPVIATYLDTGLVPRLPTAVLSTGLVLLAFISFSSGLILDTVTRGRKEMKRLHYLSLPSFLGSRGTDDSRNPA